MIDGVKILVSSLVAEKWLNNAYLQFTARVNMRTGEIGNTLTAKYNGLLFTIKNDENGKVLNGFVSGSLHKYFNEGKHNANTFTFENLQNVVNDLRQKFGINPETAILKNLEFGVNINTPESVRVLLNSFVAYENRMFIPILNGNKLTGWELKRQQYRIKIYDKGKQFNLSDKIMRIEYAVKKMEYLKKYGIKTLQDCTDIGKLKPLGVLLVSFWDKVIFCDENRIQWDKMSYKKRAMLNEYRIPIKWQCYTPEKRKQANAQFRGIIKRFSTSTTMEEIKRNTANIWAISEGVGAFNYDDEVSEPVSIDSPKNTPNLTTCKAVKMGVKIDDKNTLKAEPQPRPENPKLTIRIKGQNGGKNIYIHSNDIINTNRKERERKKPFSSAKMNQCKKCKCCGSDISHKRAGTKYCSKKCNNKINGQKRMKAQKQKRLQENKTLDKITKLWRADKIKYLCIDIAGECVTLAPQEITTDRETINQVKKIFLHSTDGRYNDLTLTDGRARKLLRLINKKNTKADEKHTQNRQTLKT